MPEPPPLVYLDTSVWLKSIKREPGHEDSDRVIVAAAEGRINLVASWLVRAEIQTAAAADVDAATREAVEALLDRDGVRWATLERFIAQDARTLSRSLPRSLSGADAVHLATAVRAGCSHFMAYDRRFPYGSTVEGVLITEPAVVWDETLFDE